MVAGGFDAHGLEIVSFDFFVIVITAYNGNVCSSSI